MRGAGACEDKAKKTGVHSCCIAAAAIAVATSRCTSTTMAALNSEDRSTIPIPPFSLALTAARSIPAVRKQSPQSGYEQVVVDRTDERQAFGLSIFRYQSESDTNGNIRTIFELLAKDAHVTPADTVGAKNGPRHL